MDDSTPWSQRPIEPSRMNSGELSVNLAARTRDLLSCRKMLDKSFDKIRAMEWVIETQADSISRLIRILSKDPDALERARGQLPGELETLLASRASSPERPPEDPKP